MKIEFLTIAVIVTSINCSLLIAAARKTDIVDHSDFNEQEVENNVDDGVSDLVDQYLLEKDHQPVDLLQPLMRNQFVQKEPYFQPHYTSNSYNLQSRLQLLRELNKISSKMPNGDGEMSAERLLQLLAAGAGEREDGVRAGDKELAEPDSVVANPLVIRSNLVRRSDWRNSRVDPTRHRARLTPSDILTLKRKRGVCCSMDMYCFHCGR